MQGPFHHKSGELRLNNLLTADRPGAARAGKICRPHLYLEDVNCPDGEIAGRSRSNKLEGGGCGSAQWF